MKKRECRLRGKICYESQGDDKEELKEKREFRLADKAWSGEDENGEFRLVDKVGYGSVGDEEGNRREKREFQLAGKTNEVPGGNETGKREQQKRRLIAGNPDDA